MRIRAWAVVALVGCGASEPGTVARPPAGPVPGSPPASASPAIDAGVQGAQSRRSASPVAIAAPGPAAPETTAPVPADAGTAAGSLLLQLDALEMSTLATLGGNSQGGGVTVLDRAAASPASSPPASSPIVGIVAKGRGAAGDALTAARLRPGLRACANAAAVQGAPGTSASGSVVLHVSVDAQGSVRAVSHAGAVGLASGELECMMRKVALASWDPGAAGAVVLEIQRTRPATGGR